MYCNYIQRQWEDTIRCKFTQDSTNVLNWAQKLVLIPRLYESETYRDGNNRKKEFLLSWTQTHTQTSSTVTFTVGVLVVWGESPQMAQMVTFLQMTWGENLVYILSEPMLKPTGLLKHERTTTILLNYKVATDSSPTLYLHSLSTAAFQCACCRFGHSSQVSEGNILRAWILLPQPNHDRSVLSLNDQMVAYPMQLNAGPVNQVAVGGLCMFSENYNCVQISSISIMHKLNPAMD